MGSQQKKEVLHSHFSSHFSDLFFFFRERMVNSLRPKHPESLFPLNTRRRVLLGTVSWLAVFPTYPRRVPIYGSTAFLHLV